MEAESACGRDGVQGQEAAALTQRAVQEFAVVRSVQEDGTCWLGGTDWHGRAAMRISVSSFRTTHEDVERSVGAILAAAAAAVAVS